MVNKKKLRELPEPLRKAFFRLYTRKEIKYYSKASIEELEKEVERFNNSKNDKSKFVNLSKEYKRAYFRLYNRYYLKKGKRIKMSDIKLNELEEEIHNQLKKIEGIKDVSKTTYTEKPKLHKLDKSRANAFQRLRHNAKQKENKKITYKDVSMDMLNKEVARFTDEKIQATKENINNNK